MPEAWKEDVRHNKTRHLRWAMSRTPVVRAVRAWRNLLPDWTPTLDEQIALEGGTWEHRAAVAVLTDGWDANDPRWDVLMALLEWERREAVADERAHLGYADEKEAAHGVGDDALQVPGDQLAWDPEGTLPNLREVHAQAEDVQPDPEPVQQEQGDGGSEDSSGDPERGEGSGLVVERKAPAVFAVRTLASVRAERKQEE